MQHTATHCNTLQHTATHANTRKHSAEAAAKLMMLKQQMCNWTHFPPQLAVLQQLTEAQLARAGSFKRDRCILQRALYILKTAIFLSRKTAVYFDVSSKEWEDRTLNPLCFCQKSSIYPQKSPVYPQKSPINPQKNPEYPEKSPVYA